MTEKISRRSAIKAGVTAVAVGAAATLPKIAGAQTKAKYRWRMQTHWPNGVGYYDAVYVRFCDRVRTATDGEIDITPMAPGSIVPTGNVFEAIGRGMFEISLIWPSYWMGRVPVAGHINGHLFSWQNVPQMYAYFYHMGAIDVFRDAYKAQAVRYVGPVPQSGLALFSRKPLRTIDDFRGYKVRSTGVAAEVLSRAGATPVFFPGEELYQALQTGVCDGAHWGSVSTGWDMKLQEVTNYIVMPNLAEVDLGEIIMNQKLWDSLPKDLQAIIEECTKAAGIDYQIWSEYNNLKYLNEYSSKKMGEISTLDEDTVAQLQKYTVEVIDKYSSSDPKYSGKAGELLKELMKMTGQI